MCELIWKCTLYSIQYSQVNLNMESLAYTRVATIRERWPLSVDTGPYAKVMSHCLMEQSLLAVTRMLSEIQARLCTAAFLCASEIIHMSQHSLGSRKLIWSLFFCPQSSFNFNNNFDNFNKKIHFEKAFISHVNFKKRFNAFACSPVKFWCL